MKDVKDQNAEESILT